MGPSFVKGLEVTSRHLKFREAVPDDAQFILSLRLDPERNTYLSATPDDVEAQRRYLERLGDDQLYYVIEADGPVGTVRLYDPRGSSFEWGSWILRTDAPAGAAVESTCMVYALGLHMGFTASHFEVRRGNEKVWGYHERWGAVRVGEDDVEYRYEIDEAAIRAGLARYASRVSPIQVR